MCCLLPTLVNSLDQTRWLLMWWDGLQDVGFIGLGNMGGHMASNLLKAGHRLTVHDRYVISLQKPNCT